MAKKLSIAARADWVDQWRRSGRSARDFCAAGKSRPSMASLYRWSRDLGAVTEPRPVEARLVEVVPVGERVVARDDHWLWELEGANGVLRGGALDRVWIAELVAAVTGRAP